MRHVCSLRIIFFTAALLCFSNGILWATPSAQAFFTEYDLGGGLWSYDYILHNTSDPTEDAGYDIYDFFLLFDSDIFINNPAAPDNWEWIFSSGEDPFIDYYSTMPGIPPTGSDIAPGASLAGFSFTSNRRITPEFEVLFNNPSGDPVPYRGQSWNTAPIPEPSALLLLGSGLAVFGYVRKKRLHNNKQ